jgi:hypothetical protein
MTEIPEVLDSGGKGDDLSNVNAKKESLADSADEDFVHPDYAIVRGRVVHVLDDAYGLVWGDG